MTQAEKTKKIALVCEVILKKYPDHKKLKPMGRKWYAGKRKNDNKELILEEIKVQAVKFGLDEDFLIKILL